MKLSRLRELVKEVLQEYELEEANTTNVGGATFTPGDGAQYATPYAFGRKESPRAVKTLTKQGYTKVKKKKRPYSTKLYDYL
jgi:hypothetical protein|tara:strand:- start:1088 stop:1333 length:246 start_codon:yes stop_codon:yes gene_type:complete